MHKQSMNACTPACRSCHWMCNNCCCCSTPMQPRNCASCLWPRCCNNNTSSDEWRWHSRCLTDHYAKDVKQQLDTPLWRRAKRQRANAISMLNQRKTTEATTAPQSQRKKKKEQKRRRRRKIERPAEIIIDKPFACKGGYLRGLAQTPNCRCERMGALLLQPKFSNKCQCEPYELMPDVPLTFYPKIPCFDPFGNSCDDEFAAYLLRYLNGGEVSYDARLKKRLNKKFFESLNKLYAHVGGGLNGYAGDSGYNYDATEKEYEFEGFFGTIYQRKESALRKSASSDYSTRRYSSSSSTAEVEEKDFSKRFHYPTPVPLEQQPHFRSSPSQVLKYLEGAYIR